MNQLYTQAYYMIFGLLIIYRERKREPTVKFEEEMANI